jgi:hypothetical protein
VDEPQPYATPKGVEDAVKAAAKRASADDPSLTTNERIRLEYFNRFLSRVFSDGPDSEWVLKGGTGMLARVASTRATLDIDLYRGAQKKGSINVDLSTGAGLTAEPTITTPASALDLPRLVGFEYRLYPVVDQIADKVCATMQRYHDRPSSREKDLVDIIVLAVTQDIDGTALTTAITTEISRRRMDPIEQFVVPAQWGRAYKGEARGIPHCADVVEIGAAQVLAANLIDPALDGTAAGLIWRAATRGWVSL